MSNAEIAARLFVSVCTVRKHLENAYRKLGVHNRMAAVVALGGWSGRTPRARPEDPEIRLKANVAGSAPAEHSRGPPLSKGTLMTSLRRVLPALGSSLLVAPLLVAGTTAAHRRPRRGPGRRTDDDVRPRHGGRGGRRLAAHGRTDVYTEGVPTPPAGCLYLAFTSLGGPRRRPRAANRRPGRASAAIATAAHDVLAEYFPASRG